MHYAKFWNGISFNRRLTKNPKVWLTYLCWWLQFNLSQMPPNPGPRLYRLAGRLTPRLWGQIRWGDEQTELIIRRNNPGNFQPLGMNLLLIVNLALHNWIERTFCQPLTRWRGPMHAHRCDWTDPENGLLYGGSGSSMNELFAQFIENISPTPEQGIAVAQAVDDLRMNLASAAPGEEVN